MHEFFRSLASLFLWRLLALKRTPETASSDFRRRVPWVRFVISVVIVPSRYPLVYQCAGVGRKEEVTQPLCHELPTSCAAFRWRDPTRAGSKNGCIQNGPLGGPHYLGNCSTLPFPKTKPRRFSPLFCFWIRNLRLRRLISARVHEGDSLYEARIRLEGGVFAWVRVGKGSRLRSCLRVRNGNQIAGDLSAC